MHNEFTRIKALFMRGGTSKGVYLMETDLPKDRAQRDAVILNIYGSPDLRQINGMGGADPLTSKVALIAPSKRSGVDVDYTFGYVGIKEAAIDYDGNCGNISSGVGIFAILRGLVTPTSPTTCVRIFNTNTNKIIEAAIPFKDGSLIFEGDYAIAGVPGTGAKIVMNFPDSAGSKTGKLLPTGNVRDIITLADGRKIEVSLVDAANPAVFFKASDVGFTGRELPKDCEKNANILSIMEDIRTTAGVMMGLANTKQAVGPAVPKVAFVSPPQDYPTSEGETLPEAAHDFIARTMALGVMHKTYAVTGGICVATAAMIEGSVVNQVCRKDALSTGEIRVGHPSGVLEIFVDLTQSAHGEFVLNKAGVSRTARPIMEGEVFVSKKLMSA